MKKCNETTEFQCKRNLKCIDKKYLCDGDDDCGDNTDENNMQGQICGENFLADLALWLRYWDGEFRGKSSNSAGTIYELFLALTV